MKKIKLLLIILFFLISHSLYAMESIVLDNKLYKKIIGRYVEYYEDTGKKLTIDDITNKPLTWKKTGKDTIILSYSKSALWFRFQTENVNNKEIEWFLEIAYPHLDFIEFYKAGESNTYTRKDVGDHYPFYTREKIYRNFVFSIKEMPGKHIYYIRVETSSSFNIPLINWSPDAFTENIFIELPILWMFYGLMIIMVIYNLFIFFSTRDMSYFYFSMFVIGFIMYQIAMDGFAFQYLWPNYTWWANYSTPFFGNFTLLWACIFFRSYIQTKKNFPIIDKIMMIQSIVSLLCTTVVWIILSQLNYFSICMQQALLLSLIVCSSFIISSIIATVKGSRSALYFMISFTAFLLGIILISLKTYGFMPATFITDWGSQIGSAILIALLSLGLADKLNTLRKEIILAQQRAIDNLHKADILKDEFLANTSHELRTPLNGIIGIADSLMHGATGDLHAATKENLSMIVSSGKRLYSLINDVLDLSKLKNRDITLSLQPVDLYVVVDTVLALSKNLIGKKNLKLINSIKSIPPVLADENRLQQIFINLIGNAIKFTESGYIEITATTYTRLAEKKESNNWISVNVTDTGIGIPENQIDRIFESFEQGDGSIERRFGGTGLGLSITKKLIELHGGKIEVKSIPHKGSTFTITLPIASDIDCNPDAMLLANRKERNFIGNREPLETTLSNKVKDNIIKTSDQSQAIPDFQKILEIFNNENSAHLLILAVDDDAINLQVIVNQLSLRNFKVVTASSGDEAIGLLKKDNNIDLMLLDVMMPGMSGYKTCEIIREQYKLMELPIILLTARNHPNDLLTGFAVGANDYITKPFTSEELISRVNFHLKLSSSMRMLKQTMQKLEELNLNLEQKVEERTVELKAAIEEVEAINENLIRINKKLETAQRIANVDLNMAINIQKKILPNYIPESDEWEIFYYFKPMAGVSGDFYDFYNIDNELIGVGLFDVSGHGIASGLITMIAKSLLFRAFRMGLNIELNKILENANKELINEIGKVDNYVTGILLRLRKNKVEYVNAGHPDIIYKNLKTDEIKIITKDNNESIRGTFLGKESLDSPFELLTFNVNSGDYILLYTDCLDESNDINNRRFGIENIIKAYKEAPVSSSKDVLHFIYNRFEKFIGNKNLSDDLTIIVLRKK